MSDNLQLIPEEKNKRGRLVVAVAALSAIAAGTVLWMGVRPVTPVSTYAVGVVTFALGFLTMFTICTLTARRRLTAAEQSKDFADKTLASEVRQLTREVGVRRDVEKALYAAMEAAEMANEAKTDFLANVSHELKTPMTAIISSADLLLTSPHDGESYELLKIVKKASDNMMVLIGNLLELARGEKGKYRTRTVELRPARSHRCDCQTVYAEGDRQGYPAFLQHRSQCP